MGRGILDRFFKQEVGGIDLQKEALEEQLYMAQMAQQQGMGYSGGQPLPPAPMTVIPPAMEKEIMERYLDVPLPEDRDNLKGSNRFWIQTTDAIRHLAFTSLNAAQQKIILDELRIARDFDGCDNVDKLIQDKMDSVMARVQTDKSRNDYKDAIRERLVPSVGYSVGLTGPFGQKDTGERPKESRTFFGLFGGGKQRG